MNEGRIMDPIMEGDLLEKSIGIGRQKRAHCRSELEFKRRANYNMKSKLSDGKATIQKEN